MAPVFARADRDSGRRGGDLPSVQPAPAPPQQSNRIRGFVLDLLPRLYRWAESGWSGHAAAAWGLLQSSVVPGPSEGLLIPLGLADPPRVFRLALWTIAGAMVGGFIAYGIGALTNAGVANPIAAWVGMDARQLAGLRATFAARGWVMVILLSLPALGSSKWACIAAGAFGVPLPQFAGALLVTRGVRFLAVAGLIHFAGDRVEVWVERRTGRTIASLSRSLGRPRAPREPSP